MSEALDAIKARVARSNSASAVEGVEKLCDYVAGLEESFEALRGAMEMLVEAVRSINKDTLEALANAEARIAAIEERNAAIDLMQGEAMKGEEGQ